MIDLRSDTVTQPTAAMRRAMFEAIVGDDVYGEDPTVKHLEDLAADTMGKEAALFCPTGTMANELAIMSHTHPGDEVIIDGDSHIYYYEVGGMARLSGVMPRTIRTHGGKMTVEQLRESIRPSNIHFPTTTLLCLENPHNRAGGVVWSIGELSTLVDSAHEMGLRVHLDGARIFHAACVLQRPVEDIVRPVDTVMFCISKGLGAPVGSLLAGSTELITRARKLRKLMGGGMRQSGIVAAAGVVALQTMTDRLQDDHRNARLIYDGIHSLPGLRVLLPQTNMVMVTIDETLMSGSEASTRLRAEGILANPMDPQRLRLVTHKDVNQADCEYVVSAFQRIFSNP